MPTKLKEVDVVIVGLGWTGGILAKELTETGLKVVAPSTAYDAKGLLKAAIRDDNPVVYFEHKYLYRRARGPVPEGDEIVPIGVAATRREGDDITLVTYGAMVAPSLEAADRLAIRELVEAYAHCADRRDAKGQMALFTEDTHFVV